MTGPLIGIDIGSMTVKGVIAQAGSTRPFQWYDRHHGRPSRAVGRFLTALAREHAGLSGTARVFVTGSGAAPLAPLLNARFVQEVNAVAAVVEREHPSVRTVIDLGGQDAKIIVWHEQDGSGRLRRFTSMNDKCAGGTGATIDRIIRKLGVTPDLLAALSFDSAKVRPVAGKCGIFAETDINSLLKNGASVEECLLSLFAAIIDQNITTLAKGRILRPAVLLLGGPNAFIPALRGAWAEAFKQPSVRDGLPVGPLSAAELVHCPEAAVFYAARGCALLGNAVYRDTKENRLPPLEELLRGLSERDAQRHTASRHVLAEPGFEPEAFRRRVFAPAVPAPAPDSDTGACFALGIDSGSTSSKGVVIDAGGGVIAHAYRLGDNNPLREAQFVIRELYDQLSPIQRRQVRSLSVTGYAKDYLRQALGADYSVVETVAHTVAAQRFYGDIDVILDVGGQDIKIIFLKQGVVNDFRLNTQCSAGNGFYLQNAASRFHVPLEKYADAAFSAGAMPHFNTGCAVFLESDIVQYQQEGWSPHQILAGLAAVLPRNVWEYVVQEPDLARFGRRFILQGGAHRNLAVVKAQYDYIRKRVPEAEVIVHHYCAETGAIGAALEALRRDRGRPLHGTDAPSVFERVLHARYDVRRDESTRCAACSNRCLRTLLTVQNDSGGGRDVMIASCEKGAARNENEVKDWSSRRAAAIGANPDFTRRVSDGLFSLLPGAAPAVAEKKRLFRRSIRKLPRIGIPRTLNMWRSGAFFRSYLHAIGIPPQNIIWSGVTSQELWQEGGKYNIVDLCFPGKYGVAHVHDLLRKGVDVIFNPALVSLEAGGSGAVSSAACPVAMANPDVVKACYTVTEDLFQLQGTAYHAPVFHLHDPEIFSRELCRFSEQVFRINRRAHHAAFRQAQALSDRFFSGLRSDARETLRRIVREGRVGILFLGRPYHDDPGLNHGIPAELQARGYPVFTIESLPRDQDLLGRIFADDIKAGRIGDPLEISDVWKHSLSENTNRKVWAAKFAARVPNLAIVDYVSFRCGPDATILHVVERIARAAGTPYFTFHDMDQNRAAGSIQIRIETIDHFLRAYRTGLGRRDDGSGIF